MSIASQLAKFPRGLEFGLTEPVVLELQQKLRKLGYWVEENGHYDRRTEVSVYGFQRHSRLEHKNGCVDLQTAEAIDAATGSHADSRMIEKRGEPVIAKIANPIWIDAGLWIVDGFPPQPAEAHKIDWSKPPASTFENREMEAVHGSVRFINDCLCQTGVIPIEQAQERPIDYANPQWGGSSLHDVGLGAIVPMQDGQKDHVAIVIGKDHLGRVMCIGKNQDRFATVEPFAPERLNKGYWWPTIFPRPIALGIGNLPRVYETGHFSHFEGGQHGVVS